MFNLIKHLLPSGSAWSIIADKMLRRFFLALAGVFENARASVDSVWLEIFPATTTSLDEWDEQFGLPDGALTDAQRRARIAGEWQYVGSQGVDSIQDILRARGFDDVFVHEWWVPGSDPLEARNPAEFISDGSDAFAVVCGLQTAVCGHQDAVAGATFAPRGYLLVNGLEDNPSIPGGANQEPEYLTVCAGFTAVCGHEEAVAGRRSNPIQGANAFRYVLYFGGETFPQLANVSGARRREFENLCLSLKPAQQWLGMLINYT